MKRGHRGHDRMVVGFSNTCVISAYLAITTNVVSSNPAHSEVYSIQHYVCQWLATAGLWFSLCTPVASIYKTDGSRYLTEIIVVSGLKLHKPRKTIIMKITLDIQDYLQKLYGWHHELVDHYEIFISQIKMDLYHFT